MRVAINPQQRVTSGGSYKDFDTITEALKYLESRVKIFAYGSINKVYTFEKIDEKDEKEKSQKCTERKES